MRSAVPRSAWPVLLASLLLTGCSGKETAEDCGQAETFNPHEERCVRSVDPGTEVCHAWLSGGVGEGKGDLICQARSDGEAWLDIGITASSAFPVEVRDGAGQVVYQQRVQVPASVQLSGTAGGWTLEVDYDGAAGTGSTVLWG